MHRFLVTHQAQQNSPSLEAWIQSCCKSLSRDHDICFEFDFSTGMEGASYCQRLTMTLEEILEKATLSSPPGSSVVVGTYWTRRGLEVEVSTCTDSVDEGAMSAFRKESSSVGSGYSLSVYRARCPQGGIAWIIVQSHFARLRMVA
jgi:hypothetical protein